MKYKRKAIESLLLLMALFAVIFLLALFDQQNNVQIFNMGMGIENYLVMIFCLLSIVKVIFEIGHIEKE